MGGKWFRANKQSSSVTLKLSCTEHKVNINTQSIRKYQHSTHTHTAQTTLHYYYYYYYVENKQKQLHLATERKETVMSQTKWVSIVKSNRALPASL